MYNSNKTGRKLKLKEGLKKIFKSKSDIILISLIIAAAIFSLLPKGINKYETMPIKWINPGIKCSTSNLDNLSVSVNVPLT